MAILRDLREFSSTLWGLVNIRVVNLGQPIICPLDLLLVSILTHSKDLCVSYVLPCGFLRLSPRLINNLSDWSIITLALHYTIRIYKELNTHIASAILLIYFL